MSRLLVLVFFFGPLAHAQNMRVRSEGGRFWIECQSAPLEEVLREIAAHSPMELWLDEGLSGKRVSASAEGATLKQALEEVFEEVKDVNYVLTFDPSNPERVMKIYAGGGGAGRLGREPTVAASEPEPEMEPELPPELDPEALLESPEAQEALGALRQFLEQKHALQDGDGAVSSDTPPPELSELPELPELPELEDLLKNLPQLSRGSFTPGPTPPPPTKKEKPNRPQL